MAFGYFVVHGVYCTSMWVWVSSSRGLHGTRVRRLFLFVFGLVPATCTRFAADEICTSSPLLVCANLLHSTYKYRQPLPPEGFARQKADLGYLDVAVNPSNKLPHASAIVKPRS